MRNASSLVVPLLLTAGLAACGRSPANTENAATEGAAEAETGSTADMANGLPLKRGYYVAGDTPCGQASNATVMLLRRNGIGGARDFCAFKKVEKAGPNVYRVTEACGDFQDRGPPESGVTTYTLRGDMAFTSKSEHGWEVSARYCAQSTMPPDFRANDIRDVTR